MGGVLLDAVVVGAGPNGLAAAVALAEAGCAVRVIEAAEEVGGGTRTAALTLPGFAHDVCSAVHPMGVLSPYLRTLPLAEHGLEWVTGDYSVAHPLDGGRAALLERSLSATAARLGEDGPRYAGLLGPFLRRPERLMVDLLGPLGWPRGPLALMRFGWYGVRSARGLARRFRTDEARALLAGCAAHSILPLERLLTGAVGMVFALTAHMADWPCARGGSAAIARALVGYLEALGGEVEVGREVTALEALPPARVYLFDLSPRLLLKIAGDALPSGYRRRLERYRYGPGAFKVDWALSGPIPWANEACGRASTVHVGGTLEEIAASEAAVWRGEHPARPFVLVCQQSALDATRAPAGQHTGYAYCHVPAGSTVDCVDAIEAQIERFAPGFRSRVLARHVMTPAWFEAHNPNYHGGAITGGVADLGQLFTRPVARFNPYTTPNPKILLCSASTPPGGGVHGMCGYHAAQTALRRMGKGRRALPAG